MLMFEIQIALHEHTVSFIPLCVTNKWFENTQIINLYQMIYKFGFISWKKRSLHNIYVRVKHKYFVKKICF